jgi:hypothetical protein
VTAVRVIAEPADGWLLVAAALEPVTGADPTGVVDEAGPVVAAAAELPPGCVALVLAVPPAPLVGVVLTTPLVPPVPMLLVFVLVPVLAALPGPLVPAVVFVAALTAGAPVAVAVVPAAPVPAVPAVPVVPAVLVVPAVPVVPALPEDGRLLVPGGDAAVEPVAPAAVPPRPVVPEDATTEPSASDRSAGYGIWSGSIVSDSGRRGVAAGAWRGAAGRPAGAAPATVCRAVDGVADIVRAA